MKKTTHLCLLFCFIFGITSVTAAKSSPMASFTAASPALDTLPDEGFGEPIEVTRESSQARSPFREKKVEPSKVIREQSITVDTSYVQVADIPKSYTGFKIEILNTEEPLPAAHDIFFHHGNLSLEELGKKEFSYTLGSFTSRDEAMVFMQDFLLKRYPEAKVVEYEAGERLY